MHFLRLLCVRPGHIIVFGQYQKNVKIRTKIMNFVLSQYELILVVDVGFRLGHMSYNENILIYFLDDPKSKEASRIWYGWWRVHGEVMVVLGQVLQNHKRDDSWQKKRPPYGCPDSFPQKEDWSTRLVFLKSHAQVGLVWCNLYCTYVVKLPVQLKYIDPFSIIVKVFKIKNRDEWIVNIAGSR